MWGSLSAKDFDTKPELIECKKFMRKAERKLDRKRRNDIDKFDELKKIVTTQLKTEGEPQVTKQEGTIQTRISYIKENNPYITARIVTYVGEKSKEVTAEKLFITSGPSDAYDITVEKLGRNGFSYEID